MKEELIHKHTYNPFKAWHLFVIVIPSFIFFFSVYFFSGKSQVKSSAFAIEKPTPEPKITITIGETVIQAVKADTENERRIGLSNHTSLPRSEGMLFIMPPQSPNPDDRYPLSFWMKDMDFPIDIIWIKEGKIFQIHKDVPPEPGRRDIELTNYFPNQHPEYVLEVNAGLSDEKDIQVGDEVKFDAF